MDIESRGIGSLVGLAVGDAVGTAVEFKKPGTFDTITEMIGGGPFDLEQGQWTDDTSMALCLADSLVQTRKFDLRDQLNRYLLWFHDGYLSSTGACFDIGNTVRQALTRYSRTDAPYSGLTDPSSAGNGSLMRVAPVPIFYHATPRKALDMSGESSKTTHGLQVCVDACRYHAGLILGALTGIDKDTLLSAHFSPVKGYIKKSSFSAEIFEIASGSFKHKEPPEITGSGYVVHSLEAALWAFFKSNSFKDAILLAVNLGDDADTTAAITGQLAGAYYGYESIPDEWVHKLYARDSIIKFARSLLQGPKGPRVSIELE